MNGGAGTILLWWWNHQLLTPTHYLPQQIHDVFPQSKRSTSGRAGERVDEEGILLVDSTVLTRRMEEEKLVEPTNYLIKNRKIAGIATNL